MPNMLVQYDRYERHRAASLLLAETECHQVLDIGGVKGSLAPHLRGTTILALNVNCAGDVQYGGRAVPIADEAFDAVISLDTIEHIPRERRQEFMTECIRVSRNTVLIAAPLGTPGHSAYEAKLDVLHKEAYGQYHDMLHEHVLHGLPTTEDLRAWGRLFDQHGFSSQVWYAGNYEWQCRSMERSLRLVQWLGTVGKLVSLLNLVTSLAIWHRVTLSKQPTETSNRFYLSAERRPTESGCFRTRKSGS